LLNAVNAAPAFASAVAKEAGASPSVARMAYAAATVMDWTTPGVPAGSTAVIALSSLKNPKAAYNVARKAYDKMKSAAVPAKSAKTGVEESMRRALKGAHATRQPEAWMIAYFAALDKGATRESAMQFATAYTGENLHNAAVQRYMKEHSYDC